MNDELDNLDALEAILRQQPLRKPSANLDQRIAVTLRPGKWHWGWPATIGSLAAAAAVLLAILPLLPRSAQVPSTPTVQHAQAELPSQIVQTDTQWVDEGVVDVHTQGAIRQYRVNTLQKVYCSTDNGPAVVTIPNEQVVYLLSQPY